ncbi:peroxidase family protein [Noviherbaspirillum sp.]|uniref:peroxidase family protein n=1 Tax=Noviherbaspirillum sp. TaxID=1926288 RepID=UPI002FE10119
MKKLHSLLLPIFCLSIVLDWAFAQTVEAPFPSAPPDPNNVFSRMFPDLPPFSEQTDSARRAMQLLGARDGILNAQDNMSDPVQSILNPTVFSPRNADNPQMPAGMTFLGQFLDHDVTLDKNSLLNENALPEQTQNFRTAAFDLDSLYGDGPADSPHLYETSTGRIRFVVQAIPDSDAVSRRGAVRDDVPRNGAGTAIIGDSRNDQNIILSQLHLALLSFHNAVTDHLARQPEYRQASPDRIFNDARRLVTWHYQWIILHEFLPVLIGQRQLDRILSQGTQFFRPEQRPDGRGMTRIPVEFAVAAYRFGHSQVRPSYRLNFGPTSGSPFFAFVFDDTINPNATDPDDLRGGKRAPRRFVDWQTFFDFGDGNVRPNKRIDTKLSSVLMHLPGARLPSPGLPFDGLQSLPARTLTRHVNFGLPSGQAIARRMNLRVLTPAELGDLSHLAADSSHTLDTSTPLFFYILREAEVMEGGLRLGPVGSGIVGEVFVGLLKADNASILNAAPDWTPTLPSARAGQFTMTDLLRFAGVVPPL